jgi:hypothetical protein
MLLAPHSGLIPIASFCVEAGRWSARGAEDARTFSSANAALPSREAKLEMAGSGGSRPAGVGAPAVVTRQQFIWKSVKEVQSKLSSNLGAPVAAPQSQSSLQLTLENRRLEREQADYLAALQARGEQDDDIVGYVFAVNGKVNSADIYPSNALFRKMWPKLLRASVTEAISDRDAPAAPAPTTAAVSGFISQANSARAVDTTVGDKARVRKRESAGALLMEARPAAAPPSAWVHRNYLAK